MSPILLLFLIIATPCVAVVPEVFVSWRIYDRTLATPTEFLMQGAGIDIMCYYNSKLTNKSPPAGTMTLEYRNASNAVKAIKLKLDTPDREGHLFVRTTGGTRVGNDSLGDYSCVWTSTNGAVIRSKDHFPLRYALCSSATICKSKTLTSDDTCFCLDRIKGNKIIHEECGYFTEEICVPGALPWMTDPANVKSSYYRMHFIYTMEPLGIIIDNAENETLCMKLAQSHTEPFPHFYMDDHSNFVENPYNKFNISLGHFSRSEFRVQMVEEEIIKFGIMGEAWGTPASEARVISSTPTVHAECTIGSRGSQHAIKFKFDMNLQQSATISDMYKFEGTDELNITALDPTFDRTSAQVVHPITCSATVFDIDNSHLSATVWTAVYIIDVYNAMKQYRDVQEKTIRALGKETCQIQTPQRSMIQGDTEHIGYVRPTATVEMTLNDGTPTCSVKWGFEIEFCDIQRQTVSFHMRDIQVAQNTTLSTVLVSGNETAIFFAVVFALAFFGLLGFMKRDDVSNLFKYKRMFETPVVRNVNDVTIMNVQT